MGRLAITFIESLDHCVSFLLLFKVCKSKLPFMLSFFFPLLCSLERQFRGVVFLTEPILTDGDGSVGYPDAFTSSLG